MSDSGSNLFARVAGLMFLVTIGAGVYAFITHGNLQAMEARLAAVEQERTQLKSELLGTEQTVLANSSELKTCTKELQAFKGRAQNQTAPQDSSSPKAVKSSGASL